MACASLDRAFVLARRHGRAPGRRPADHRERPAFELASPHPQSGRSIAIAWAVLEGGPDWQEVGRQPANAPAQPQQDAPRCVARVLFARRGARPCQTGIRFQAHRESCRAPTRRTETLVLSQALSPTASHTQPTFHRCWALTHCSSHSRNSLARSSRWLMVMHGCGRAALKAAPNPTFIDGRR
jgi:hypothetical protein